MLFSDEKQKNYTYFVGENEVLVNNNCGIDTGSDYLNSLLNNSKQLPNNKGKARCFEAAGGWDNLLKDFSNLNLSNLKGYFDTIWCRKTGFP